MDLLWDGFEEIWNIIGFANIGDCIYVNTTSDLNYMKVPGLFHGRVRKFTERYLNPNIDPSDYRPLASFLSKLEEVVNQNIDDLCPTPEAWKVWLKLQGREDSDVKYSTAVDKTLDELMALIKTVELIGDK